METKNGADIECKDDRELLEFLLTYLCDNAYNQLILNEYPDGYPLSEDELSFNFKMAYSVGAEPVMAYRVSEYHYKCYNKKTGLTAVIPIDLVDQ